MMASNILRNVWPEWQIEKQLGKGSFGVVYKAVRRDHNVESFAAIKVISIPSDSSEIDSLRSEGLDMNGTRTYFQGIVNDFVSEIQLMESLKGIQNIVSVEDYKVVEKTGEIGWDIYIRMELLTPFSSYICDRKMTEAEVIKLGCDICTALEICSKRNVIHRDIKPENIFINDFGDFKLGDFGIARKMENLTAGLSQKGTFFYMAPDVANGQNYDARVDLYSLGIVLYRLLNQNRLPFLDTNKQLLSPTERRNSVDRRLRGEALPAPCEASPEMANLILRACAFDPNNRFSSATEMKQALTRVANGTYVIGADDLSETRRVRKAASDLNGTKSVRKAPIARNHSGANTFGVESKSVFDSLKNTIFTYKDKLVGLFSKNNGTQKTGIIVSVALLLVIAMIFILISISNNSSIEQQILRELEAGNYDAVIEIYNEDYTDKDADDLTEVLAERISQLKMDFSANKIDYDTIVKEMATIEDIGESLVYDELSELETFVETVNESRIAFDAAESYFDEEDYINAIKQYQTVSELDSNYTIAQKQLEKASGAYREGIISNADAYAVSGDYENAVLVLNEGLTLLSDDTVLSEKLDEYNTAINDRESRLAALNTAKVFADSGDAKGAITTISEAMMGNNKDNQELANAYNTYCASYESNTIKTADELFKTRKYTEAVNTINEAITFLPDSDVLIAKKEELSAKKPISITSLSSINSSRWQWNKGIPKDPFGNNYSGACNFVIFHNQSSDERSVEYRTYGEYQTMTGVIAPHANIGKETTCNVLVYADNDLVYSSPVVAQKTDSFTFAADISNAEYVKIVVRFSYTHAFDVFVDRLIISDVQLWS